MVKPLGVSNEEQFHTYRVFTEARLMGPRSNVNTGIPVRDHAQIIAEWMNRYRERAVHIQALPGWGDKLADTAAMDALIARNLAKDAEWPQLPDWDEDTQSAIDMQLKRFSRERSEFSSLSELCKFGPSLRRLWGGAKARGATDEEAWGAIREWARHRPEVWKNDDERKRRGLTSEQVGPGPRLEETVTWQKTTDVDFPWSAEHNGARWQVRINDFPDEHMYTLFVNGESVGDFDNWPEAWDRGEPRVEKARLPVRPAIAIHGHFMERYLAGEHETVWAELVSLGSEVRNPQYKSEAEAVARETMRRARHNVELLIRRLDDMGYKFSQAKRSRGKAVDHLQDKHVFMPPGKNEKKELDEWERQGVVLPVSLRMWMEEVGSVDLTGSHPALSFLEHEGNFPGVYADPLMVAPNADLLEQLMGLTGEKETDLLISFDAHDKAWVGSNEQLDSDYWMEVPNEGADGLLKEEKHGLYFVQYLRLSFRWGGFPGWADQPQRPDKELAVLTDQLLPL